MEDSEITYGELPAGSTNLDSKSMMDQYPEDEVISKPIKKPNTSKGKKNNNKSKK